MSERDTTGPVSGRELGSSILRALNVNPALVTECSLHFSAGVAELRVTHVIRQGSLEQPILEMARYDLVPKDGAPELFRAG